MFDFIVVPLPTFCVFLSLRVTFVVLVLVFLPGLNFAAYRRAFIA